MPASTTGRSATSRATPTWRWQRQWISQRWRRCGPGCARGSRPVRCATRRVSAATSAPRCGRPGATGARRRHRMRDERWQMDRWYPDRIMAGSIDDYLPRLSDPAYTTGLIQALGQLFAGRDRRLLKFAEFGVWKGATTGQLARFL